MSARELVILGSSSAVPTKRRNHNGYFLRWDAHGVLLDPGEGTQRQMRFAGLSAHDVTRICVTHFHGDHCLGIPGVVQRIARDRVEHPVHAVFPRAGEEYWRRLRHATAFGDTDAIAEHPVEGEAALLDEELRGGPEDRSGRLAVTALPLRHRIPTYGYRLAEPDGWRMLPGRLAARGVHGPAVGALLREGRVRNAAGELVRLEECAEPRPGQVFAFVMDTAVCANAVRLARGADLLVIESTYLQSEAALAASYAHLTAAQAGRIAAEARVRRLVLTHVSERYEPGDDARFLAEAGAEFGGEIVLAADLDRVAVPRRPR
ncbi:ribonuclease Z [Nocardiopsis mwathae]|uniref:Ribonuclease Z n=1 Tax=Nocardiopsis mwathae TaxID=1472723 RepID=A0A7W9YGV0_9ACTN|nr:ribonuclease Z [Nocardiopsis mwathae]MBB6171705.1 ribonuclease Z [Nocardiopsis mwathae]